MAEVANEEEAVRNPELISHKVVAIERDHSEYAGITLRDLAAIVAMEGVLANDTGGLIFDSPMVAKIAVTQADALLAELGKQA